MPAGADERLLEEAGFEVREVVDRTEKRFFEVAARLAAERRLSRFAFRARRP